MPTQYYYADPDTADVHGPFLSKDLVVLAHSGVLRPEYYVSKDQETWFPATNVNGLIFPEIKDESERTAAEILSDTDAVNTSLNAFMQQQSHEQSESKETSEASDDDEIERWLEFPEMSSAEQYVPFRPKSRPPIERPNIDNSGTAPAKSASTRPTDNETEKSPPTAPSAPPPLPVGVSASQFQEATDFRVPNASETVLWEGDGCFVTDVRFHFSGRDDLQRRGERSETTVFLDHISHIQTRDVYHWSPVWFVAIAGAVAGLIGLVLSSTSDIRPDNWIPRALGITGGVVLAIAVCVFKKRTGLVIECGRSKFFEFSESHHAWSVANAIVGVITQKS